MNIPCDPLELARSLVTRSVCAVQVAAVIRDSSGIFAWGWNHSGRTGMGMHAEEHACRRANDRRLVGAHIYIASRRKGRFITSKPCDRCHNLLVSYGIRCVTYYINGHWRQETI